MKKHLIVILGISLILPIFYSCQGVSNSSLSDSLYVTTPTNQYPLLSSFIKGFIKNHPNINKNDIYIKEANADFKKACNKFISDKKALAELPLKVVSMYQSFDNPHKYVVHLNHMAGYTSGDIIDKCGYDFIVLIDKKIAIDLIQDDDHKYLINDFTKIEPLENIGDIKTYTNDMVWNTDAEIEQKADPADCTYSIGNYLVITNKLSEVKLKN